jgi:hypothetical protein
MIVKRSDRKARWVALRRRKSVAVDLPFPVERESAVSETMVTAIPRPGPAVSERPPEREWNIWDLERRAREEAGDAVRDQEWAALFMHLRQFANADGVLPTQFDGLVRESFSRLIQAA